MPASHAATARLADAPHDAADPLDQLIDALARSTLASIAHAAERQGVPLRDVRVAAELALDDRREVEDLRLRIEVDSPAPEDAVARVLEQAERRCLVSQLLGYEADRVVVHQRTE